MPRPTDRGYVRISDDGEGTQRVDVFARPPSNKAAKPYATHFKVQALKIQGTSGFDRQGTILVSTEPMAVFWSEPDGQLFVQDA